MILVIDGGVTHRVEGVAASLVRLITIHAGELRSDGGEITLTWGKHQSEIYSTQKLGITPRDK